ncbi:MAG: two-component regulator propeller domain-containing protein [Paludibacteraceae bacterium]
MTNLIRSNILVSLFVNVMKIKLLYIALFLFFSVNLTAENDIYFSKTNMENGLSQLSVTSIYQDELGSMWFGTREGVNRYNGGNSMTVILPVANSANSLSGSLIKSICGNQNGSVYIQTQNGVDEYNLQTSKITSIERKQIDAIYYGSYNLWLADGTNLYSYINGEKNFLCSLKQSASPIKVIFQTQDNRILLGTVSSGIFMINQNNEVSRLIPDCSQISSIFEDGKRNIWIGTWHDGLYKLQRNGELLRYHKGANDTRSGISSEFVRDICEDNDGNIWIGTNKGLDKFSPVTGEFKHYGIDEFNNMQLSNESVWALLKDKQGTIWVGTYFGGVNYFNPDVNFYTFHNLKKGVFRNKPFPIISTIVEANNENLFLCTEGDGLIYYNLKDKTYRTFTNQPNNPNSLGSNNIKTVYYDPVKKELWLGLHLGGINKLDLNSFQITRFNDIKPEFQQSDIVRTILPYNDRFLIATYNGIYLFDKTTRQFTLFSEKLHKTVSFCTNIALDKKDNLWISGRGLHRYNLGTGTLKSYFPYTKDVHSLSNMNVVKVMIDSKDQIWVATNGGGVNLYNEETDNFTRYDKSTCEIKNDYVSNIIESRLGNIIIATTQGFSILDTKNNKIYNYGAENGLPLNSLYNGGMSLLKNGEIYMAGMNGMVSFFEDKLSLQRRFFNIKLSDIWINYKQILPGDESGILKKNLPYTNAIRLNYKQSMVTIEFASNNYIQTNEPQYRYKLQGLSNEWVNLPLGSNKLNFMNLTPGKYKLILEAVSQIDGSVVDGTELDIKMSPPFYSSWLAYLLYVLMITFAVSRYLAFTRSKLLLKTSLEYEKKEKQHIEEVNQSKLRFFTNISHEFRTPLTLISGQVDMLLQMHNIAPHIYGKILNIKRNTHNMQNLINELLEFRKSEQGFLTIKLSEQNLVEFLKEIYLSFVDYAKYRHIKFNFDCGEEKITLWFDPNQMQKVFYNLISNAFKYTEENGTIDIVVKPTNETVNIDILDSGIGISAEALEKIFDRFYQAENGLGNNNMTHGTGIGLALTKNILELHSGTIKVHSVPNKGSVFTVTLRKGDLHFTSEQKKDAENIENLSTDYTDIPDDEYMQEIIDAQPKEPENKYAMLIVEDNADLRDMLVKIFEPIYKIYTANDGEEGLSKAIEHQPSIVLSDLMMPKMSGSEMCAKIKSNFSVCHIPVVLLTAQTAMEYNIEGLRLGADDYITKPFNVKVLITRCNNLVNGRKILQEKFSKQTDISPAIIATNEIDRKFLEKAYAVLEKNIDNPDFDVAMFSGEMAFGRTKLFGKIKGITGQTPNDFILNYKMKRATDLLTNHPEFNIADITYMLGFSFPKYFSKCFKEQFGVSPSTYRKKHTGTDMQEEEEE